jgi:hypothetical protein
MIEQDKSRIQAFTGLAGSLYKGWVHTAQPWQVHDHDHSRRSAKKKEVYLDREKLVYNQFL